MESQKTQNPETPCNLHKEYDQESNIGHQLHHFGNEPWAVIANAQKDRVEKMLSMFAVEKIPKKPEDD